MPALLDRVHQTVKVGAERLQAGGIQEEAALAGSMGRGARGGAALLREGNLLVLAEELDFALREAQLVVGDGGGHHNRLAVCTMLVASQGKQQPCMARPMRAGRAACVRARRRDSTLGGGIGKRHRLHGGKASPPGQADGMGRGRGRGHYVWGAMGRPKPVAAQLARPPPHAARRTPLGTGRDSRLPCRRRPPARPAAPMAGASGLLPLQLARVGGRGEGGGGGPLPPATVPQWSRWVVPALPVPAQAPHLHGAFIHDPRCFSESWRTFLTCRCHASRTRVIVHIDSM